jgi:hypothetical protein
MNLENTNSYGFNSQPIQISLRQNKPPDITSVETPVEPNSPLTVPSDSFVKSLDNEGGSCRRYANLECYYTMGWESL